METTGIYGITIPLPTPHPVFSSCLQNSFSTIPLTARVLFYDKMITVYPLIFIYYSSCDDQKQTASLYLSLILSYLKSTACSHSISCSAECSQTHRIWLLLWRCKPGKNKGRTKTKQPQTRVPGRALTAKSGLAAEAAATSLSLSASLCVSPMHTEANIDLEK